MTGYLLPHHVHFCSRGDALVFADLTHDDYILVKGDAAAAIRLLSSGMQADEAPPQSADPLKELLECGLLTRDPEAGRRIAATAIDLATERLVCFESMPEIHVTAAHVLHFVAACVTSALRLRCASLGYVMRSIEQRKTRHSSASTTVDIGSARELTAIFQQVRSFFPRNYLCLYDSLALLDFLARYRIFPTLVFGVKLEPWAAHCWVQEGQYIFNEGVEEAAQYSPVMTI